MGVGVFGGLNVWGRERILLKFLPKKFEYSHYGYALMVATILQNIIYVRKIFLMDDIFE